MSGILRTIHVLGAGNIGSLVAFSLRSIERPPTITLLLRSHDAVEGFMSKGASINLLDGQANTSRSGFLAESSDGNTNEYQTQIKNLIVTTKTYQTTSALNMIKHRLCKDSTILFLQNGMGVTEEVATNVFPDVLKRPRFLHGIITHGINSSERYSIRLAGKGTVMIENTPDSTQLGEMLQQCSLLSTSILTPTNLLIAQLEKLAINAGINPLTAIHNCRNGELLENLETSDMMRQISAEVSSVFTRMKETELVPNREYLFSPDMLFEKIQQIARMTGNNKSSMLQDALKGQPTEIDYINGFVVRKGRELGIELPVNSSLVEQVKTLKLAN
ncbi:ketopantoate reductase PanE/ApbA C terminal-domain-containing protein [Geopyxis carbonaria]|nr:ketopantoate reductase PanE/ApbA C terminal-domain-containing protein [Geopyxis carbonaria]